MLRNPVLDCPKESFADNMMQLGMAFLAFTFPENERVFLYTFTIALLVDSVSYYTQAADLVWFALVQVDQHASSGRSLTRQISYARYAYRAVSFPAVILAFGLQHLSGLDLGTLIPRCPRRD